MKKTKTESEKIHNNVGRWTLDVGREKRPCVFLDRDGTIIDELGYLGDPEGVRLYPGAGRALAGLCDAGYLLIIVTNQSGIARGYFSHEAATAVNLEVNRQLRNEGVKVAGIYFCPHMPDGKCSCRKPAAGMIRRAEFDLGVDPGSSWVVGDTDMDVRLGLNAGLKTILVRTGKENKGDIPLGTLAAADLAEAAGIILEECN